MDTPGTPYGPVAASAELDSRLSRRLWLVKWILVIPHWIVLCFLWIVFFVVTVIAFFAILFTERFPRGLFDFNLGVLRWSWRVSYYSYESSSAGSAPPASTAASGTSTYGSCGTGRAASTPR